MSPSNEAGPKKRAWGPWALRVAGAAIVVTLLTVWLPTDELITAARSVPITVWVASFLGFLASHVGGASKWFVLMRASGAGVAYPVAIRSHLAGLFGNLFLPSVIGGDALRVGTAVGQAEKPAGVISATVLDRALDMIVLALLAAASGALAPGGSDGSLQQVGLLLALIAVGLWIAWVTLGLLARRLPADKPGAGFIKKVHEASLQLAGRPKALLIAGAATVVVQGALVLIAWQIGLACGIDVSLAVWAFGWTLGKVAAVLPLTLGGIGVREAALAGVLAPFGVPAAQAVAAGLVFECVIIAGGLFGGLVMLLTRGSQPQRVAQPTG